MRTSRTKGKAKKIIASVLGFLLVAGAVGIMVYRDHNLHTEARIISRALDAGFVEKQATIDGATINYGEGPDNGPALLLIHGQGMEWEDYASVLPDLASRYHVFAIDCYGHGASEHDPSLYTCAINGDALIEFADQVIGEDYIVSGHSSGGILAAYVAANDPDHVTACVLEDPPLFRVTPEEAQEGAGTFVWYDGYTVAHSFLQQDEVKSYPTWYASHSYLFAMFGNLQPMLAKQTARWCADHPDEHVVNAWVPRAWTRGMYFMNDYDAKFGDAFYDGSWMSGIDQESMLQQIQCPVVYLKTTTRYGDDGVLYAATTDEDAEHVCTCLSDCTFTEIDSGHDIHVERPSDFIQAVDEAA
ncbi:MAG: alpha/beta hydrolase [Eggerthellaceae bacterium]|nr:alpha/beta hydrolase [Eggerthellaceae bacterium]